MRGNVFFFFFSLFSSPKRKDRRERAFLKEGKEWTKEREKATCVCGGDYLFRALFSLPVLLLIFFWFCSVFLVFLLLFGRFVFPPFFFFIFLVCSSLTMIVQVTELFFFAFSLLFLHTVWSLT
jgi:hypothetical protein